MDLLIRMLVTLALFGSSAVADLATRPPAPSGWQETMTQDTGSPTYLERCRRDHARLWEVGETVELGCFPPSPWTTDEQQRTAR